MVSEQRWTRSVLRPTYTVNQDDWIEVGSTTAVRPIGSFADNNRVAQVNFQEKGPAEQKPAKKFDFEGVPLDIVARKRGQRFDEEDEY